MKFKHKNSSYLNEYGISDNSSLNYQICKQNILQVQDYNELQKLLYQAILQFISTNDKDCKQTLKSILTFSNVSSLVNKLSIMILQDQWKKVKIQAFKQEVQKDKQKQVILIAIGLNQLIEATEKIDTEIYENDYFIKRGFLDLLCRSEQDIIEEFIRDMIKLILKVGDDSFYNINSLLEQVLKVLTTFVSFDLKFKELVTQEIVKEFTNLENQRQVYQALKQKLSFDENCQSMLNQLYKMYIQKQDLNILGKKLMTVFKEKDPNQLYETFLNFTSDEESVQHYFKEFSNQYKQYLKSIDKSIIEDILFWYNSLIEFLQNSPFAQLFLMTLIQINHQVLRGYQVAYELAMFIQVKLSVIDEKTLLQSLVYSLDKDKMEQELRKMLLIRIIDQDNFDLKLEQRLIKLLQQYYGTNFTHRFNLILKEDQLTQKINEQLSITLIPSAVWVNEISNPYKSQILHPTLQSIVQSFQNDYSIKFNNRILNFMQQQGQVVLVLDKQLELEVNPFQASILLYFNNYNEMDIDQISEQKLQVQPDVLYHQLKPLIQNEILQINGSKMKLIGKTSKEMKKSKCTITSQQILEYNKEKLLNNMESNKERQNIQKYIHKEDKFKVQSFIIRLMKQDRKIESEILIQQVIAKYKNEGLEMVEEDVQKCINELIEREFICTENDCYIYQH